MEGHKYFPQHFTKESVNRTLQTLHLTLKGMETLTKYKFIGKEKDICKYFTENMEYIALECKWDKVRNYKEEYVLLTKHGRIQVDCMIWHDNGTGTIIEFKANKIKNTAWGLSAIGQILYYGSMVEMILGKLPRMVIASNEITTALKFIIKQYKLPIQLMQIDGEEVSYY